MIRTLDFGGIAAGMSVSDQYREAGVLISASQDAGGVIARKAEGEEREEGSALALSATAEGTTTGSIFFDFLSLVRLKSLTFKNLAAGEGTGTRMIFYDASGAEIDNHFVDPTGAGQGREIGLDIKGVARLEVRFAGEGEIAGLSFAAGSPAEMGKAPGKTKPPLEPENSAPVAGDDTLSTGIGEAIENIDVLANDFDPDVGDALRVISAESDDGIVQVNGDGTLNFQPAEGFSGAATVRYRIADRPDETEALFDVGLVTILVGQVQGDGFVDGGPADDLINAAYVGDPQGDVVDGSDALLPGRAPQDDDIRAGAGDDTVFAALGADRVEGGAGDDLIFTGDDRDTVFGGAGDDAIDGGSDDDLLLGDHGDDLIIGGQGDDILLGGDGSDQLSGGAGADRLFGDAGRDQFFGLGAGDDVTGGEGPEDFDTLDLRGSAPEGGRLRISYAATDPESGTVNYFDSDGDDAGALNFREIEAVVPCFTPGTLIATPLGERRVEDLQLGDRVITRDNGMQKICWIGRRDMTAKDLAATRSLQPVLIRAGALGNGLPERDMAVSPNHRVLVVDDKAALFFEEREVLVAAKHLLDRPGICREPVAETTYLHFMFEQHEVVLSDGCWTESFQPGAMALAGVDRQQRGELLELFPQLAATGGATAFGSARRSLKAHEAQLLVQ